MSTTKNEKPTAMKALEQITGRSLCLILPDGKDLLRNVMACRFDIKGQWICQYSLGQNGSISGLNLAGIGLTDEQWNDILKKVDIAQIEALNLRDNSLYNNPLTSNMRNLRYIDLCNNKLSSFVLPVDMPELTHVFLYGNKGIETPPIEIIEQGRHALIHYFQDMRQSEASRIYEAKVLIVGAGGSGKTTLLRRLINGMQEGDLPTEVESTHGIEVHDKWFNDNETPPFQAHFWDFGGQEIYHATHQFFLTKRSLYLLVADARKEDADFDYWLQVIELLGGNSPVIIVQNEKAGRSKDLNIPGLKNRFVNVKMLHSLDLGDTKQSVKLSHLLEDIESQLRRLPHVGEGLPGSWIKIRRELESIRINKQHISTEKYLEVCARHGKEKDDALFVSQYLHDVGFFLHFQDDPVLKHSIILHNAWATKGVYTLLDSEIVKQQGKGKFNKEQAVRIWEMQYGTNSIFQGMYDELLHLMLKFEICYRLPDVKDTFISPQLLPAAEAEASLVWNNEHNLQLRYHYDFLPKGLMCRLIVRLHRYLRDYKNEAWQSGAILHKNDSSAKMLEEYASNYFHFRARGIEAKSLIILISEEVDRLNAGFHNLHVKKLVPCNCNDCKQRKDPNFYEYEDLMRRKAKEKSTIECKFSYSNVTVDDLIDYNRVIAYKPKISKIFISYSIKDEEHLNNLKKHLVPFEAEKGISTWDDGNLFPGDNRDEIVNQQMSSADIIILLVSADFLASKNNQRETDLAIERYIRKEIFLIPVIVRPCDWSETPFAQYNPLPSNGWPITKWEDADHAWEVVIKQLKTLINRDQTVRELHLLQQKFPNLWQPIQPHQPGPL